MRICSLFVDGSRYRTIASSARTRTNSLLFPFPPFNGKSSALGVMTAAYLTKDPDVRNAMREGKNGYTRMGGQTEGRKEWTGRREDGATFLTIFAFAVQHRVDHGTTWREERVKAEKTPTQQHRESAILFRSVSNGNVNGSPPPS